MSLVGSHPNLLYYSWKLNNTGDFKLHLLNEEIDPSQEIIISNLDSNDSVVFKPDNIYKEFQNLSLQTKYDIILLSSKSLQDISNVSSNLSPFLKKNSIILIESTGFVNLEPFLKNCLPSSGAGTSIFSLLSTLDVRKFDQNQYLINNIQSQVIPEILIGESSTNNVKYQSTTLTNLVTISKIFKSSMDIKITVKNTYLEFLTEQWKLAIPQICFDPLLILFEESKPETLQNQILAKPLLSGLVTELITVAKTMGCRLPIGYDNESNFFKRWCDLYPNSSSSNSTSSIKYLGSPSFFYNFFYKYNLDIDMLLLQPILLADDYGIKTPYLEFLYATICQFAKFNNSNDDSIFFKRSDDSKLIALTQSHEELQGKLSSREAELGQLSNKYRELSMLQQNQKERELSFKQSAKDKELQYNQLVSSMEGLKIQNQNLQQQLQKRIVQQQNQPQPQQKEAQQYEAPPVSQQSQYSSDRSMNQAVDSTPVHNPHNSVQYNGAIKNSIEGTPDLRDLTDVALLSAQMESPVKNNKDTSMPQQVPPSLPNGGEANGYGNVNGNGIPQPQPQSQQNGGVNKELELQKKEQLLYSKEMELNKKLSQLQRQQPPQQPQFQQSGPGVPYQQGGQPQHPHHQHHGSHQSHHHGGHHLQNGGSLHHPSPLYSMTNSSRNQVIPGPNGLQQQNQSQLTNGLPNGVGSVGAMGGMSGMGAMATGYGLQQPLQSLPQQPQARRVSTMPTLDSNDMFANPQFKKTSRKNRKSSFPLVTPGMDDNYGMPMPTNLNNRLARNHNQFSGVQSQQPQPQGQLQQQMQPQPLAQSSTQSIPQVAQPQSQQSQPYRPNPTKAFTSPTIPTENPYSTSNSASNSNSASSNELGTNTGAPQEDAKPLGIVGGAPKSEEKKKKKGLFRKK